MKKNLITFVVLIVLSTSIYGENFVDGVINYFDNLINTTQNLRHENALIKSKTELAFYSKLDSPSFPLNILNENDKQIFIESLKFNQKGLTSYNYEVLNNLKQSDKYKILSLFGFENNTEYLLEKNINTKTCIFRKRIETKGCGPLIGYSCASKGTCKSNSGHACTSNC